jgi:hypothetical protein
VGRGVRLPVLSDCTETSSLMFCTYVQCLFADIESHNNESCGHCHHICAVHVSYIKPYDISH